MLGHHLRYVWYLVAGTSTVPALRLGEAWWNEVYKHGGLARTEGDVELPRHLLVAGLVRHYAPGGAVLDVGCGTGGLTVPLRDSLGRSSSRYLGVDLSPSALEIATARTRTVESSPNRASTFEFVQADFDAYAPCDPFDAIVFSESLYYAPDPLRTIRHYAAALGTRGILVISMWRRPSRMRIWHAINHELLEISRSCLRVPRRPAWDIVVYERP